MNQDQATLSLLAVSTWVLPLVFAITLHEAAHGYVAWKLGDDTAKRQNRVSFNPLRHIDLLGTIVIPGLLVLLRFPLIFGWAKPVPVSFARLRHPRRDAILVAAAGPGINFAMAVAAALSLHLVPLAPAGAAEWVESNLLNAIFINLLLGVFNGLPLPPLDGSRVVASLLPGSLSRRFLDLDAYGLWIVLGLFFALPLILERVGINFNAFYWLILAPVDWLTEIIAGLTMTRIILPV
ncbi:MAG: site-2 protease family protein [Limibacillus sp.]